MAPYKITRPTGETRIATSLYDALKTARLMLGVARIYRGAQYEVSAHDAGEAANALDIWTSRREAGMQTSASAPVVISWNL